MELAKELGEEPAKELIEPTLNKHLHFFVSAFHKLGTERTAGMNGISSIPITSVIIFAERYCINRSQQERLIDYVLHLDKAYVNACNKRNSTDDDEDEDGED